MYGRVLGTILAESQGVHPSDRWRDPNANLQTYPLLTSVFRQGPELYINAMRDTLGDFSQTNFRNSYIIQKQRQIWLKLNTFLLQAGVAGHSQSCLRITRVLDRKTRNSQQDTINIHILCYYSVQNIEQKDTLIHTHTKNAKIQILFTKNKQNHTIKKTCVHMKRGRCNTPMDTHIFHLTETLRQNFCLPWNFWQWKKNTNVTVTGNPGSVSFEASWHRERTRIFRVQLLTLLIGGEKMIVMRFRPNFLKVHKCEKQDSGILSTSYNLLVLDMFLLSSSFTSGWVIYMAKWIEIRNNNAVIHTVIHLHSLHMFESLHHC